MSDHLTNTQIENYDRCLLSATESMSVSNHLAGCEECRQRLESALNDDEEYLELKAVLLGEVEGVSSSPGQYHLTFEEMADLVDGVLGGEELQVAQDHLACCEQCDLTIRDLKSFKDRIVPRLKSERLPSASQTPAGDRWGRLFAAISSFRPRSPALVFGSALAVLLLAAGGLLAWREWSGAGEKPKIATATPQPGISPPASPNPTESPVLVQINDGDRLLAMDREGHLTGAEHLPLAYRQMVERVLTMQKIERSPLLSELTRPEDTSRGRGRRDEEFSVIAPFGEVTLSDQPTFTWSPLKGATGYMVEVYDQKLNLEAASPQITGRSWTALQPLRRGEVYFWLVKAIKDGRTVITPSPPAQSAKFMVLDQARFAKLLQARRGYGSSHLTMGLLYVQAGLLHEAEQELRELQKANPDSVLAGRLLSQVLEMRQVLKIRRP